MCGIAGIINTDPAAVVHPDQIDKMCQAIHHRGPDDMGIWCNRHVGIGMKRLSIIDLTGGHQPIHNEDKTCWIVFNGEIYNFKELREELEKRGHVFSTSSDTETILHLYEDYREHCVDHLNGMFAFAVWDEKEQTLFIARDHLGIKPLHYFFDGQSLIFGSEIKSILRSGMVQPEMDPQALVNYFFYGYVPDPETMFKGIQKLPPAHHLTLKKGQLSIKRYWNVHFEPDYSHSEQYFIERSLELMQSAVKMRLISEVPLGAFLSGGVDSSLVVAY
jgi:asparagine synthase (glutamine-hydrolysing)